MQPSTSPFAFPVLLIKKKDSSWRFCVDYKKLNDLTVKNKFPMPIIEDLLSEFHGGNIFSKIDLRQGYFQIRLREDDQHKFTFVTYHGLFEFKGMPFGLTNVPTKFQNIMNRVFSHLLR